MARQGESGGANPSGQLHLSKSRACVVSRAERVLGEALKPFKREDYSLGWCASRLMRLLVIGFAVTKVGRYADFDTPDTTYFDFRVEKVCAKVSAQRQPDGT